MTGPDHYAEAERLLALAGRHSSGATYGPEWTLTLAAAQIHATLALAAATAVGTAGPDGHAWADVAATMPNAREPQAPAASDPGSGPVPRRPPPLFPPEPGPRH
jgi:4-hydroxybenzoate polyprenyltransferase